ncbi:tetratricopeptide repeat protein, partial [bacterium]|nr:tetratricopeptide repeat protein [bacterium]
MALDLKEEIKLLKKKERSNPLLFARIAQLEYDLGNVKKATKRLEKGLKSYPNYSNARAILANCYSDLNHYNKAENQWKIVLDEDPGNQRALQQYLSLLQLTGNTKEMLDVALTLFSNNPFREELREKAVKVIRNQTSTLDSPESWKKDWHPADFTQLGSLAKHIVDALDVFVKRSDIPHELSPKIDDAQLRELIEKYRALFDKLGGIEEIGKSSRTAIGASISSGKVIPEIVEKLEEAEQLSEAQIEKLFEDLEKDDEDDEFTQDDISELFRKKSELQKPSKKSEPDTEQINVEDLSESELEGFLEKSGAFDIEGMEAEIFGTSDSEEVSDTSEGDDAFESELERI